MIIYGSFLDRNPNIKDAFHENRCVLMLDLGWGEWEDDNCVHHRSVDMMKWLHEANFEYDKFVAAGTIPLYPITGFIFKDSVEASLFMLKFNIVIDYEFDPEL